MPGENTPIRPRDPGHRTEVKQYAVTSCVWLLLLGIVVFIQGGLTGSLFRQLVEAALWWNAAPLNKGWVAFQICWDIFYPLALWRLSSVARLPDDAAAVPAYDERKSSFQYLVTLRDSTIGQLGLTLFLAGFTLGLIPWRSEYFRDYRLIGAAFFLVALLPAALIVSRCSSKRIHPA
ncbi:hypothetical protein A1Q1_03058 [Trichosporon asahii var. asahii CBS 2479]|nr:hypothetical protein A1Q1_03058 [Trichosporon asahii var. asahii CBS 2479]EJT52604.1 hypothetical protein A1Q1_03058 [Trichosporon asahii var. asahii CBS 2479]